MKALDGVKKIQTTRINLCKVKQRAILIGGSGKFMDSIIASLVTAVSSLGSMETFIRENLKHKSKVAAYGKDTKLFVGELFRKPTKSAELLDMADKISELSNGVSGMGDDPVNRVIIEEGTNKRIKPTKAYFGHQKKAFNAMASAYDELTVEIKKSNAADDKAAIKIATVKEDAESALGKEQQAAAKPKAPAKPKAKAKAKAKPKAKAKAKPVVKAKPKTKAKK